MVIAVNFIFNLRAIALLGLEEERLKEQWLK
jgi:hypothetical protein